MRAIAYTVIATLPDEGTASEYLAWLREGHVAAVIHGGAESGEIVRVTEPGLPLQIEVRYRFSSREAFERYVRDFAGPLRADGIQRFPPERGIRFERRLGEVC